MWSVLGGGLMQAVLDVVGCGVLWAGGLASVVTSTGSPAPHWEGVKC
jgi:hypothetical protein